MKKSLATAAAIAAGITASSAQGLYSIATLDDDYESKPLRFTAGLGYHFDDNVSPLSGLEEEASSVEAFIRAEIARRTERTQWDAYLQVGYLYYFDDPSAAVFSDDGFLNIFAGANLTHRVSERLRYVTRNSAQRALEPDYSVGITTTRQSEPYTNLATDHAIGYRWTERLATYTGIQATAILYDGVLDVLDRETFGFYHQFRYQLSPQTVATFDYRWTETSASGTAGDINNQYVLAGVEHRFSPVSIVTLRAGAQIRDVDGGEGETLPFIEGGFSTKLSPVTSLNGFVRYGAEDFGSSLPFRTFDTIETLRVGFKVNHRVTERFAVYGGVDFIDTSFSEGRIVGTPPMGMVPPTRDRDEQLINYNIGFSYAVTDAWSLTGTYNLTDVTSSDNTGDYDRNRFNLGVQTQF